MSKTITYVGAGAFRSGTGALTGATAVNFNAGIRTGDLLFILIHSVNETITIPTGWTEVGDQTVQAVGTAAAQEAVRLAVCYKFAVTPEASVTIADSGNLTCAQSMAFRFVNRYNPFIATSGGAQASTTANTTLPAITTTVPESLILFAMAVGEDNASTANFTSLTNANLTGITERIDQTVGTQTGGGLAAWTATSTLARNIGTSTAAKNGAWLDSTAYLTIGLRPAARRFSIT